VALGRWRQQLARRQLRSRSRLPTAVLHAHGCRSRQSRRDVFPLRDVQSLAQRRRDAQRNRSRRRSWAWSGRCGRAGGFTSPGGDNHDIWIDPTNPQRIVVGNDAGVQISTTRGRTWLHVQLPIAQIYHATVDNRVPYYVYGNKQDGPSYRGPSNSRSGNAISRSEWHGVEGGESGWATPDPVDPNLIWSTASGSGSRGGITRFDGARGRVRMEFGPEHRGYSGR
jgi:hypothetical protein